ncbi:MAG TPA: hypothetical protein VMO47_02810 [Rhodothermales bacterium]|nr:hypothetical protein [Rhodothermales bacterium]
MGARTKLGHSLSSVGEYVKQKTSPAIRDPELGTVAFSACIAISHPTPGLLCHTDRREDRKAFEWDIERWTLYRWAGLGVYLLSSGPTNGPAGRRFGWEAGIRTGAMADGGGAVSAYGILVRDSAAGQAK